MNNSEFIKGYSYPTEMRGLSAKQIAAEMKCGWNLGNSFESENNETYWGNPKTTKEMIDKIAGRGFTSLRVPVRWDNNYIDSNYTIKNDYMNRIETVLNYGLSNNMYVIVNIHHNAIQTMVKPDLSIQKRTKDELSKVWTQIATRFKNYGDKLIFEIINEPRLDENWDGDNGLYEILNVYNEISRKAIRSTGGNNTKRLILLPTYCASSDKKKLLGWKSLSDDEMIAVSIHAYKPFNFAFDGNGHSEWNRYDERELNEMFNELNEIFLKKNITVVMGEFGSVNKNNVEQRVLHALKYTKIAKSLGIPCLWWDNNCFSVGAEQFGMFDRKKLEFKYGKIADAIINTFNGIESQIENVDVNSNSNKNSGHSQPFIEIFNGSSSASNWNQAVSIDTLKHNGPFDCFNIDPNGCFFVEYSGKKGEIELILQSWSDGDKWCKVESNNSGELNGHFYSQYSYQNCVNSFGTSDFVGKLDKIYIGAKQNEITVFRVRYYFNKQTEIKVDNDKSSQSNHSTNDNKIPNGSLIFKGDSTASNWGQAVAIETMKNRGPFDSSMLKSGGYFYVEYDGNKNELEFILQSWSGAANWAKVDISESGNVNGHFYSKFSYENCTNAFGTSDFVNKLDKIYVGAKVSQVRVLSLYYCGN